MQNHALNDLSVAIASDSLQQRSNLRRVIEKVGFKVVLSEPLTRLFIRKLMTSEAEVLILDLQDDIEHDEELFDELLDSARQPIIFNDVSALTVNETDRQQKKYFGLMQKIAESTGRDDWDSTSLIEPISIDDVMRAEKTSSSSYAKQGKELSEAATHVWVLGASLGGPEALKRFLCGLPSDIPVAFIVAQHLGANFASLLAEQLSRITELKVITPEEHHVLKHGEVIIAPVNERMLLNKDGQIELEILHNESPYSPSIDLVVRDVAKRYDVHSGAIIFSGMCDDGQYGSQIMRDYGGQVWVQSSESCVISSMPDSVDKKCGASFSGNPEELAENLVLYFNEEQQECAG